MKTTKRQRAVLQLAKAAQEGVAQKCLLSHMELETEEQKRRLGQEQMDKKLASLPPEGTRPKACPRCGKNARVRAKEVSHLIEWLSDNGPIYTAHAARDFGRGLGFIICTTPAYSPESNGMAEAFVKTFKRDYVYVNELWSAAHVLAQLPIWFADYNENAPHKGLKMMSPRQYREAQKTGVPESGYPVERRLYGQPEASFSEEASENTHSNRSVIVNN